MLLTSSVRFLVALATFIVLANPRTRSHDVHYYTFIIERTPITMLGHTYNVVTVNGQLPGPTLYVRNGNTLIVKVYNRAQYEGCPSSARPLLPQLPPYKDTAAVFRFTRGLRSLNSRDYPVDVPKIIDEYIFSTVGLGLLPCPNGTTCGGPNNTRFTASMNNVSFAEPTIAILQAYYFGINGVYSTDFPSMPPVAFNYTGDNIPQSLYAPISGTKVKVLNYNATVQMVFQGTNIYVADNHPMHLHGFDFFVVGEGSGNYNPRTDPATFNLVDPPLRNTVGVPVNGWAAIRFRAENAGVWFMHCHLDDHMTW